MSLVDVRRGLVSEGPHGHQAESSAAVRSAVARAREAAPAWSATSTADRVQVLSSAARRVRRRDTELAEVIAAETGIRIADAWVGVGAAAAALDYFAELASLSRGRAVQSGWGGMELVVPEPFGVAAVLPAWFDPAAGACRAIAACLVAGNTVVFGPSARAAASGALVAEVLDLPPGVLSLVLPAGPEAVAADPDVDLVWTAGASAEVGRMLGLAGSRRARTVAEGGGKDPMIIDAGVDPAWAATHAAAGAFAATPPSGVSAERIYVHEAVAKPFLEALAEEARRRSCGSPLQPAIDVGWLSDDEHTALVDVHVADALARGASCITGGTRHGRAYEPTVLSACTPAMRVMHEETHGPIAAVQVVADAAEAVAAANAAGAGHSATVLTAETATAQMAWRGLRFDTVRVNGPWLDHAPVDGSELLSRVTRTKTVQLAP